MVGVLLVGLLGHGASVAMCSTVRPTAAVPDPCATERDELGRYAMEAARTLSAVVIGSGSFRAP